MTDKGHYFFDNLVNRHAIALNPARTVRGETLNVMDPLLRPLLPIRPSYHAFASDERCAPRR